MLLEPREIPITRNQLRYTMFYTQRSNVRVVDQVPCHSGVLRDLHHQVNVIIGFMKQKQTRRLEHALEIVQGNGQRNRRVIDSRMGYDPEKFVDTGPWDSPRERPFTKLNQ